MKLKLATVLLPGFVLALTLAPAGLAQSSSARNDNSIKQDTKDAAHSAGRAAKKTGHEIKKGTKKTVHKGAHATKKAPKKWSERPSPAPRPLRDR